MKLTEEMLKSHWVPVKNARIRKFGQEYQYDVGHCPEHGVLIHFSQILKSSRDVMPSGTGYFIEQLDHVYPNGTFKVLEEHQVVTECDKNLRKRLGLGELAVYV